MREVYNYDDYMLDRLIEAVVTQEIPIVFSERFGKLIDKIDHPISKSLIDLSRSNTKYKLSYIDLDDSGIDKVSFITNTKVIELFAKNKEVDKEDLNIFDSTFKNLKYNNPELNKIIFSKNRSITTIGKLINKLFPKKFPAGGEPGQDIQSFVDKFKSNRDIGSLELVNGSDIVHWYNQENYSTDGGERGTLWSSCMRYEECQNYIQFYADNINVFSLLILKDKNNPDKIKGRSIVWKLSNPDRIYMDRIYTMDSYDEELFKQYAKNKGWLYKKNQNMRDDEEIVDTIDDTVTERKLYVNIIETSSTDEYPYMDTLKYVDFDEGVITNNIDHFNDTYWTLEDTNGGYDANENDRIWVDYYGEYISEEDLTYCELGDEYRKNEDAIWLDYYNESATEEFIRNYMTYCKYADNHYNYNNYRGDGDYVEVYGTDEYATNEYAESNLTYSQYLDKYLDPNDEVYSKHHDSYLYEPESVEVYTDVEQTETDYRDEDDDSWFTWDGDDEKYDNDITIEELQEYKKENED